MMGPDVQLSLTTSRASSLLALARAVLFVRRFGREGGDDLLEARVATQRVPFRIKT
jgi:hypothetical protein